MTEWQFTIPWPIAQRGKFAGRPVPALTANFHLTPMAAYSRSKRLRTATFSWAFAQSLRLDIPPAERKRILRLTLIRGHRQRLLDKDGMYVALKPVVDGLRDARLLVDDSEKWVDYEATQRKDNDIGAAIIVVLREEKSPPTTQHVGGREKGG